jgi:hypothetical protein
MTAMFPIPVQRKIVAVDVAGSTNRNNVERAQLREDMYSLLEKTLFSCGITDDLRDGFMDRGDGAIILIHPVDKISKPLLIDRFVPLLREQLGAHASDGPGRQFRLRVAMHAGDVHFDRRGAFGEDVDVACRLLDSPDLKALLASTTEPLVLVVSEYIYQSVVKHGYSGIDPAEFQPLVRVRVGEQVQRGWVQVS